MFPIRLNLLSPQKRNLVERLVYVQFIRNAVEIAVILLAICGMVLTASDLVLQDHLNDLTESMVAISSRDAEKNKRLKAVNELLLETELLQARYMLWSDIAVPAADAIPRGVVLTGLTLDHPGKKWVFAGEAKTRDDLLALQKNLESLPVVASAAVPISQLTGKENLVFSITASLK